MANTFKIFIAALIGSLLFLGSVTRFHHHIDGVQICFCSGVLAEKACDHCHHSHDFASHSDSQDSDSDTDRHHCPLHLDSFLKSDYQSFDTHHDGCQHSHCDFCSPLAFSPVCNSAPFILAHPDIPLPLSGHTPVSHRRGPPVC